MKFYIGRLLLVIILVASILTIPQIVAERRGQYKPYTPTRIEWMTSLFEREVLHNIVMYDAPILRYSLSPSAEDDAGIEVTIVWKNDASVAFRNTIRDYMVQILEIHLLGMYRTHGWEPNPTILFIEEQNDKEINRTTHRVDTSSLKRTQREPVKSVQQPNAAPSSPVPPSASDRTFTVLELVDAWDSYTDQRVKVLIPKGEHVSGTTIEIGVIGKGMVYFHFPADAVGQLSQFTNERSYLTENVFVEGIVKASELGWEYRIRECILTSP